MAPDPVRVALYGRLADDSNLTALLSDPTAIFHRKAPAGSVPPYVILNRQSGIERWTFGEGFQEAMWLVKGICRGESAAPAEAVDSACRPLLHKVRLDIPGGRLTVIRESDVDYGEPADGEEWQHVGGLYRLWHP
jgi:hypothetical protein